MELYVETNNQSRAALAAGFGRNVGSAAVIASRLLKRVHIKNAVEQRNAEVMAALDFTPDRIIREFAKVAGVNAGDYLRINAKGQPFIDFSKTTREQLAAVSSVEKGPKGTRYKTHDKLRALTELAKIARLYPAERHEHSGPDGGPIQVAEAHKVDVASLDHDQRDQLRRTLLMLRAKQEATDADER